MDNMLLSRSPAPVHRGEVNLLGLGLSVTIGAVLIYGAISFATGLFSANDVQTEYSYGTTIITNARARLKTDGIYDFSGATDMTGTFIQLGGAPKSMIVGDKTSGSATLKNQFGGTVTLAPATLNGSDKAAFTVTYNAIPYEACTQFSTLMSASPNVNTTTINGTSDSGVVSAASAGKQCVGDSGSTGKNTLEFATNG